MPIIRDIVYGAVARGAGFESLCGKVGINSSDLNDSEKKLDFKQAYLTWKVAVDMTDDKLLGLHIGESTNPSILGLVGHLMQSSRDLYSSFENVCHYAETATNMFQYKMMAKGNQVVLSFKPALLWTKSSPETSHQAVDQAMAGTLNVFYLLSGKNVYPVQANFSYRRTGSLNEYERIFQSSLNFQSNNNELIFERHQLDLPVQSHDQSLLAVFSKMLTDKKKGKTKSIKDQLKEIILSEFGGQVPSIEIIASKLHLTVRSLQRKLSEEGISFRELSNGIKEEIASQLMNSRTLRVKEVAKILGYSEASAFRRAAKKWSVKSKLAKAKKRK